MKTVDVSKFTVVKAGVPCQSETPIRLERLLALMERNEEYIFWLQPAAGGIDDQFPCVSINGKYYMLNLKLEKAIFPVGAAVSRLQELRASGGRHAQAAHPQAAAQREAQDLVSVPGAHRARECARV